MVARSGRESTLCSNGLTEGVCLTVSARVWLSLLGGETTNFRQLALERHKDNFDKSRLLATLHQCEEYSGICQKSSEL